MAAKKPLLPPGSRWNTLERSPARTKENEQPQNNIGNDEVTPKLFTSVSNDQLTSLSESNYYRKPPRSISDDLLSHDKGLPRKPLPPTPPLHGKGVRTYVDSTKCNVAQSSPTNIEKPAPPYRARNNPQSPNRSPKPPVIPRKVHSSADMEDPIDKRPKPPVPRKPRTVYASNKTDRPPLPRKPNFSRSNPFEPSGPFQQTDVCRQPLNLSRENQSRIKIPVNEAKKSKPSLEKMVLSKSVDTGIGLAVKDIPTPVSNDRPASMILTSQVLYIAVK